jgi:hypothetical protein
MARCYPTRWRSTLRIKTRPQFRRHNRTQIVALPKHAITNPRDEVVHQIAHPARHHAQHRREHSPTAAQSPKNMQERFGTHQQFTAARQYHHAIRQSRATLRRHSRLKRLALQRRKSKRLPVAVLPQNKLHRAMAQPAMPIIKKVFRSRRFRSHQKSIARAPGAPASGSRDASPRASRIFTCHANRDCGNASAFLLASVSENL